jgi:outer membrane protein assembly factor BamB
MNGLWWSLKARGRRVSRFGVLVLVMIVIAFFFRFAVRYEGSADGSAWPQLAFRWQAKDLPSVPKLVEKQAAITTEVITLPAGLKDMPRFFGEKGDGILPAAEFATDWTAKPPREVWRIAMGAGWSGFAIAGHRGLTQEQRDNMECVTCYDVRDGKLLWSHTDKALFTEMLGGDGPRATPTIDIGTSTVFTLGGTGILNCLDLVTGTPKWHADVLQDGGASKNLEWGKSSAPLLTPQHVICSGGDNGASLIAYDRGTGKLAWKAGTDGGSYASPVLMNLAGHEQIVTVNRGSVTGHDPADGSIRWTFEWPGGFPKVGQPVAAGTNRVLITSSYGLKSHLLEISDARQPKVIWAESNPRTKFSSASISGGHAYALDEGTLCCVNLENGERAWREGRYGFGQQIRVGEDLLLVQAEKGFVVLVKLSPEKLIELGRIEALKSKTWNPPTLAGRWLIVRNDREAVCYELQP